MKAKSGWGAGRPGGQEGPPEPLLGPRNGEERGKPDGRKGLGSLACFPFT